ncbi:MAG TPA: long-chain fatty acid--CoA ligase [Polyangiaceae bacterium]
MASPLTLVDWLERTCERHEHRPSLGQKCGSQFDWITYGDLAHRVASARSLLTDLGIAPNDRVAIIADNCLHWATLCYATAAVRGVFVPMYTAQTPIEWAHILNDCAAKICFCGTATILEQLRAHCSELPELAHLIGLQPSTDIAGDGAAQIEQGLNYDPPLERPSPDDLAAIIYTSGTTGAAKGVMLSHRNITSNALAGASLFTIDSTDRSLSFLPWAHAFGQTVDLHLLLGAGVAVAINDDVSNLLPNLKLARPTILVAVPRVFNRIHDNVRKQLRRRSKPVRYLFERGLEASMARTRGEALTIRQRAMLSVANRLLFAKVRDRVGGCLRFTICGSAALSREVAEFVSALGIELYEGYGLTEASPVVSVNTPTCRRFGSVGPPLPGVTVQIDRGVTGDERHGEILVRGPNVMQGYFGRPDETAEAITQDGALRTGDLGYLDDAGCLVISGRSKEQYKLENGKYVVPSPIEERLRSSPLIANCIVYGSDKPYNVALVVPDEEGLRLHAARVGQEFPNTLSDPAIKRWLLNEVRALSRELRAFERPKRIAVCEQDFTLEAGLLTPTLKPKRDEIVKRFRDQLDALYVSTRAND